MKVVLINTPYLYIYGSINVGHNYTFPLGLGYIAAVLRKGGHDVALLDIEPKNLTQTDLETKLREILPDIVGITCATPNFKRACEIAKIVRRATKAIIVLGGVHASSMPETILTKHTEFDLIVVGEGEYTMLELCNKGFCNLDLIKGIAFRNNGGIHRTPNRSLIENVDELPFPARDLVDMSKYRLQVHLDRGKKSATMLTSRGCPARCTFCATFITMGRGFRAHSPEYVVREIEHLVNTYGVEVISFVDDTFTINKARAMRICNLILERGIKIDWFCFARVNTVDRELLTLMRKAGCFCLLYGIESANEGILRDIKKGITLNQAREALKISNELGFKTEASFIFGFPNDTKETIEETIDFAIELNPIVASFNRLVPYPSTEIYEKYYKSCFGEDSWESFVPKGTNVVAMSNSVSKEELQQYSVLAYKRFYLRPRQLLRMFMAIKSFAELKVYVRGGFGLLRQMLSWKKKSGGLSNGNR